MYRIDQAGTFTLGDRSVRRLGYGAMQLAGRGVFGARRGAERAYLAAADLALPQDAVEELNAFGREPAR
jgi:hypothetical protein